MPAPIYTPTNVTNPAYQLRFSWSAWSSAGDFPAKLDEVAFSNVQARWESDGIRLLEQQWTPELIQLTVSTTPQVTPVLIAARLKGRLQHALREAETPVTFSRKVSLRSIGETTTTSVQNYIRDQVASEQFVDARTAENLSQYTVHDVTADLSAPTATNSGRYWYNLHVVIVAEERYRCFDETFLGRVRDSCFRIAKAKEHQLALVSVMPDHVHLALRANIHASPEDVAIGFLSNLAYALGQKAVWRFGYYAGTFSEYDMGAVRVKQCDGGS